MNKLIEVLRLYYEGKLTQRQISKALNIARSTIGDYICKFKKSALPWPLPEEYQDEDKLSLRLKPKYLINTIPKDPPIDFVVINKELRQHKHLTLQLLYDERVEAGTMSGSYSNLALLYRKWLCKQPNYMRQTHKAGEKVFVDYSGTKVTIVDTDTGELRAAEIFVGVLGASNYIYLEATWTQTIADWTMLVQPGIRPLIAKRTQKITFF